MGKKEEERNGMEWNGKEQKEEKRIENKSDKRIKRRRDEDGKKDKWKKETRRDENRIE